MKSKTNISVVSNTGIRRKAEVIIGDSGTHTSGDILDANAVEQLISDNGGGAVIGNIGDKIIVDDSGLYQVKDGKVYPISHPDLSTQPSVLPQRYGNLEIKEVLIANGREDEIPDNATVLEAFSFNKDACVPATVKRVNAAVSLWQISNSEGIVPDFTLIRYVCQDKGGNNNNNNTNYTQEDYE